MALHWRMRVLPAGCLVLALGAAAVHAEAVFTGSGTAISGDMAIDASQGTIRGANLYHSFNVFNVLGGESAVFSGPAGIRNVITRVTGGTSEITGLRSTLIDGPLSVAISGANFYFINPHGIVIGENGSFSTSGSLYLSTADSIKLGDGGVYFADPARNSVLTVADPSAFGFLSSTPASVVLNGPWLGAPYTPAPVPAGQTFALIGGTVDIRAGAFGGSAIVAPGANVSLVSVASAGDALLSGPDVNVDGFATLGSVLISGGSFIDVGDPGDGFGNFAGTGASGSILVRAGELSLAPAGLLAQTFGDADGGTIDIRVRGDMLAGTDPDTGIVSAILVGSYGGLGAGATVHLEVGGTLRVQDGSFVISESYGPGAAGAIQIRGGAIEIRGQGPNVFTGVAGDNYDAAAGPTVSITASSLLLTDGGFVGTRNVGPGSGGNLSIEADQVRASGAIDPATGAGVVTLSLSTETTGGPAGAMHILTRTLTLEDGARISSSTGGPGAAGDLQVVASETLTIRGALSGIFTASGAGASGNAGHLQVASPRVTMQGGVIDSTTVGDGHAGAVDVHAGTLEMVDGAQIRSFSGGFDESNGGALVVGSGDAGGVHVVVDGLASISGNAPGRPTGLLAETRGAGAGGDVLLEATVLQLSDGARLSSSSLGDGLAGNIGITLGDSLVMQGSTIATQAVLSDGGNIHIVAPRLIRLGSSQITTSVQSGTGGGGNIFIDPQFVVLQDSQIIANAFGGPGGNITIVAGQLLADPATVISASSALGIDGSVNIDAPDTDVSAGLAVLPASFLDAASLLRAGCSGARAGLSSLVEVGRGGLPPDPDGYLPSLDLGRATMATAAAPGGLSVAGPAVGPLAGGRGMLLALAQAGCTP